MREPSFGEEIDVCFQDGGSRGSLKGRFILGAASPSQEWETGKGQ